MTVNSGTILSLAAKKPILAVVAILLAGIGICGPVISHLYRQEIAGLNKQIVKKDAENIELKLDKAILYRRLEVKDSVYAAQTMFIQQKANQEVKDFMDGIIADQKSRLDRQDKMVADKDKLINTNQRTIKKTEKIINVIKDAN